MPQAAGTDSKRPHIIGLTGSIGMGKSTVAAIFADAGVPVFDADAEVHRLQRSDASIITAIETAFPGTTNDAGVDRSALSKAVLGDQHALKRLEAIIHPAVALSRIEFMTKHKDAPLILFDIPLLFEKGGADNVDSIVTVSAPADVQRERVLARPGMSAEKFVHILGLQMPDAQKRELSDYIIDTGQPLEATQRDVHDLVTKLHRQTLAPNAE
jgi:dephospho-CoA kinase